MTARPWQEAITEIVGTGLTQQQVTLLLEVVSGLSASALSTGHSADIPPDDADTLDRRRTYDRIRKRNKRFEIKALAKANDVAKTANVSAGTSTGLSTGRADERCDLSSLSESVVEERGNQEEGSTAVIVEGPKRKVSRGTRLTAGAQISPDDFQFAIAAGLAPDRVLQAWAEFIDYWIGIPGQRGTKLDWCATWRNRVRAIASPKHSRGPPTRQQQPSFRQIADQLRQPDETTGIDPAESRLAGDGRLQFERDPSLL